MPPHEISSQNYAYQNGIYASEVESSSSIIDQLNGGGSLLQQLIAFLEGHINV